MGENQYDYGAWVRHYDTLFWTVTGILLAANGALLVHAANQGNSFRTGFGIGGLFLTVLTVFFAASMRELRQRFQQHLDKKTSDLISQGRILYQWFAFVAVFLALITSWTWILAEHQPTCRVAWITLGIVLALSTAIFGRLLYKPVRPSDAE